MKKIMFVVLDRAVGGVTSALSSLYNNIKSDFNVEVVQLTSTGNADISYSDVTKQASWFCNYYYGQTSNVTGWNFFLSVLVKICARVFPSIINVSTRRFEIYCRKNNIHCVIAYGEGGAANYVSKLQNIKKIVWIHYDITYYPVCYADNELYYKFDKIICVADSIAKRMGELYPNLKDRIIGIHNFIDVQRIINLSKIPLREPDSHLYDSQFTIISIGRICNVKQFCYIPKIASDLKKKNLDFKWIIIGPAHDHFQLECLLDSIRSNDVSDCVIWIGSRINPYTYLSRANLFVSTSSTEACPMVFIESRVFHVPIISNTILTAHEFVSEGKNGFIVPLHDMSDTIEKIIKNADMYQSLKSGIDVSYHNEVARGKFFSVI